ncbi:Glycosyl hydrolase 5 family protein [Sesamum angolense]|uniref:Glycosyl hydrolase 5 family protein n=1 Tax=Sesamum angolense TaxID=2727404 RepID=A0AAE1W9F7_9LAMI|nr:Glycosyl hydrolase 5 family protein [Sesamum angolense]
MYKILVRLLILSLPTLCCSLPLSTSSRWIIDEPTGARVKLVCTNWAAHLEPMLAEGLNKQPAGRIARLVVEMGFNCVRLTWATYMFTRFANLTVAQSLTRLGLEDAMEGIAVNNPGVLNLTVVDAQRAVVEALARQGVMVVLDNHVSQPMWCCGDDDGNGFFGDKYFDAEEWLQGLSIVAKLYKDTSMACFVVMQVVGISMRNELRGPLQNASVWHRYMEQGARTIQKANPRLLVIIPGLHYDLSFTYLKKAITIKLQEQISGIHWQAGFLSEGQNAAPLFVSEFGVKQVGEDRAGSLFLRCFLGYLAEMDLDWGVWALQGSYYLKHGVHGPDETYGMLDFNWSSVRNPQFLQRLHLIQHQIRDPNSTCPTYHILYHPSTGLCIRVDNNSELHATDCRNFSRWNHNGNGNPIRLVGTELCLLAAGDGLPATLSPDCSSRRSKWELASGSEFQVANKDGKGEHLCLEWNPTHSSSRVLTKKCVCLDEDDDESMDSQQTQWFHLIAANAQLNVMGESC